jgi:ferredoxin
LRDLDVVFHSFKRTVAVDIGGPFGRIPVARKVMESDVIVNVPKLKTHSQMLMTLGVKNMFGAIVGLTKSEWHVRSGVDRNLFARLLVQICQRLGPAITLIDGIMALQGQGPGKGGLPRPFGRLFGSRNAIAADLAVCRSIGLDPRTLPTHDAALALGVTQGDLQIEGDDIQVGNFVLPDLAPLSFGPKLFRKFMRRHLIQRPVTIPDTCRSCGDCRRFCPAKAVSLSRDTVVFDYERCIRCYCCIEICPHGALTAAETALGKLVRKLPMFH